MSASRVSVRAHGSDGIDATHNTDNSAAAGLLTAVCDLALCTGRIADQVLAVLLYVVSAQAAPRFVAHDTCTATPECAGPLYCALS